MNHGKKYVDAAKAVDRMKLYDSSEAIRSTGSFCHILSL